MKNLKEIVQCKLIVIVFVLLATFVFLVPKVQAQQSVNSAGANASGSGGSVSYSVGQVVYTTNTGSNGSVAQGVQQPYEISVVTAVDDAQSINLTVTVYPNPTTDFVTLQIIECEMEDLHFQLYDLNGKLLKSEKITNSESQIDMNIYAPSSYFVKVLSGNKSIKEFKIIKH